MLLYPHNIESKLGFDRIKQLVESYCNSDLGKASVQKMRVHHRYQLIDSLLQSTEEQMHQLLSGEAFPELLVFTLAPELEKSSIAGYYLSAEVLFGLKLNCELARSCKEYYKDRADDYPAWHGEIMGVRIDQNLLKRLNQVYDKNGEISDSASPKLKKIRAEIKRKETQARNDLGSILKQASDKGYTDKNSALTIKDGRLVVPLHAEHKRHVKGLVIDESTTGKTVYLEPLQVFNLNNAIRELHFEQKREIIAILTDLTRQVANNKEDLIKAEQFLGWLDFTRAKARVAVQLHACRPSFTKENNFKLVQARHPMLVIASKKLAHPVVPLDMELNDHQRIMVISGPNAGGKSVCLKTVGLLQMMLQSGMLVPVEPDTTMGCFKELFIDIGDEQSIESDLSTYSSHLQNMKYFLDHSTENSLFLIDEFGTGTEPQFGGAIAESILKGLVKKKSRGLITTHYGNLKKYADQAQGVVNAAMRFDLKKLTPLYILDPGRPGSSFALEIAATIGLPQQVLDQAKAQIGHDSIAFETLVSELELEKQRYLESNQHNKDLQKLLEEERQDYRQKAQDLQQKQKEIINNAKIEAQQLLTETNQRIEATIRNIKESNAQKSVTRQARKELNDFRKKHQPKKPEKKKLKVIPGPIKPGDLVLVKDSQAKGEVLNVYGKSAEILMGALKSKIRLDRLQKIGKAAMAPSRPVRSNIEIHKKRETFSNQLDVRGLRANEALSRVIDFIDHGMLLNITDLRILHGKGDGILRSVIRDHLEADPSVHSVSDEHVERGGAGVTLVTLR